MSVETDIIDALRTIIDPDLGKDIVSAGFIHDLKVEGKKASFRIVLTTPACPLKAEFEKKARKAVLDLPEVDEVDVTMDAKVQSAKRKIESLPDVKNVIAVASGKGGVGKSTVAANLALALKNKGATVGLLDADVYGPSMQIMFNVSGMPAKGANDKILPLRALGIDLISLGFMLPPNAPVIWRGPMVHGLLKQFLNDVEWGELDYLILDLPPGTGDAQLTLVQEAPITGAVIVTTPQDIALRDAVRGLEMFRKVDVNVIGIVENMSYFACPHCGEKTAIFATGGGSRTAKELGVPFLGEIPLEEAVRQAGDSGQPVVERDPESAAAKAFEKFAEQTAAQVSIIVNSGKDD
jgi:ATP-binding protein involved in chromosome partitioning